MSTFRLTFDVELPDDITEDDEEEFTDWLDHFIGCVEDDIYCCHPLNGRDVDVTSNYEAI